jgi:hypothetical protein
MKRGQKPQLGADIHPTGLPLIILLLEEPKPFKTVLEEIDPKILTSYAGLGE